MLSATAFAAADDVVINVDFEQYPFGNVRPSEFTSEHHNLSIEEWRDVLDNIDNIEEARFSAKPTSYGNRAYLLKIKTPKRKYGMSVAFNKGHNYVTTLFKTTDKGYEHWVNKVNKKTAVAPAPYPQVGSSSTQRGNVSYGLSVEDIVNLLKSNVNKNDIRNNSKLYSKAYVSTPFPLVGEYFDADRFEGVGEGSSVHGWGNYALKDRTTNKTNYYD